MHWMLMPLRRYADFSGRSRRLEYWMFTLGLLILYAVAAAIFFATADFAQSPDGSPTEPSGAGIALIAIFGIAMLGIIVPSIAVQVRRFHDQDRSGWMVLLGLIPYVGGLIVFVFMCLPGTPGENRYGPDPLDPSGERLSEVFS